MNRLENHGHKSKETDGELHPLNNFTKEDSGADAYATQDFSTAVCLWSIGWKTPSIILGGLLLALIVAIANYLFFQQLHGRLVESSIPQMYTSNIANALVRAFSMALTVASITAYTQLLWSRFRQEPIKVSTIDGMMTVPTSVLELLSLDFLRSSSPLWAFGLVIQLVPIATIFPPGSLVVLPQKVLSEENRLVPIYDGNYRGNGSWDAIFEYGFFVTNADGRYIWPDDRISSIAKRTILGSQYLTSTSPCGSNCSYGIEFDGPAFSCEEKQVEEIEQELVYFVGNNSYLTGAAPPRYIYPEFVASQTYRDNQFFFDIQYPTSKGTNISCVLLAAAYAANISFADGTQTINFNVTKRNPLNVTKLDGWYLWFNEVGQGMDRINEGYPHHVTDEEFANIYAKEANVTIGEAFVSSNMRAIADGLMAALSGYIAYPGSEAQAIGNTLIQQTPMVSQTRRYQNTTFNYDALTPSVIEQWLANVTLSTLSQPNHQINATVRRTPWMNAYSFAHKRSLIFAYAISLAVSACFNVCGLMALYRNGVSAKSGGFLQLLCTTTGDHLEINKKAAQACLGGDKNVTEVLKDLRVRFGELRDGGKEEVRRAGFGTVEETSVLRRRGYYGG